MRRCASGRGSTVSAVTQYVEVDAQHDRQGRVQCHPRPLWTRNPRASNGPSGMSNPHLTGLYPGRGAGARVQGLTATVRMCNIHIEPLAADFEVMRLRIINEGRYAEFLRIQPSNRCQHIVGCHH